MNTLKIKEIRIAKGMSAAMVSKLSGVSKSSISEMENDKHDATVITVCKLCKALKVTPNELINEELWKLSE